MAYDPYSRGDNPWLGNLDMPKSQPTARAGASRAASLPAKKKKEPPLDPNLRWQSGKITRDGGPGNGVSTTGSIKPAIPLPPTRPLELTAAAEPMEQAPPGGLLPPPAPPPRVTGPESTAPLAPLPSGLGSPAAQPSEGPQSGMLAPTPPGGPVINTPPAAALASTGGPTPMMDPGFMNFLRSQLFNQGRPVQ